MAQKNGAKYTEKSKAKNSEKSSVKKAVKKAPLPKKALGIPEGWFFLTETEAAVVDIRATLPEGTESDIWKEAGVLEVILGEKASMDIEEMDVTDEDAAAFLEEQGAKRLFYVSVRPEDYDRALPLMKAMIRGCGGKMLGDTPNLEPEIH